jgi:tetratricopeptide (TPR) repeat protein
MAWAVGIRLRPKSSLIETEIRLANRTPLPHPFYFWANAAVPARDDMRLVYPATRARTWQGETAWPTHEGRDLSRYDAFRWSSDSFMLDSLEDFFGVYYDQRDFGVVHVADVHECFGKKHFTWGTAAGGRIWASTLSDEDGPYCEIQSGRFVDQGTYRLLPPHHNLRWLEYWYPVKGIGGFSRANRDAAVRIARRNASLDCGVCVTHRLRGATVSISAGERALHELRVDVSPDRPFRADLPIARDWPSGPFTLTLFDPEDREVIRYTEDQPPRTLKLRAPTVAEEGPESNTAGALLRKAVHAEETSGWEEALAAYQEALDADPNCVDATVSVGRLKVYSDLDTAISRLSSAAALAPERADAAYYLGAALRRAGRLDEAEVELWRAAAAPEFAHAARIELGEIAMQRGDWPAATGVLARALTYQPEDVRALALLAAALRRNGQTTEAAAVIETAQTYAPLDRLVAAEAHFCVNATQDRVTTTGLRRLRSMLPDAADPWLALSFDYTGAGMIAEAASLLEWAIRNVPSVRDNPLAHYALASWLDKAGRQRQAAARRRQAAQLPAHLVFPHQWELERILRDGLAHDPIDAAARLAFPAGPPESAPSPEQASSLAARYYLGMLLCSQGRRKEALAEWEFAESVCARCSESLLPDSTATILHRNLGLAYREVSRNLTKAAGSLRKAVEERPSHQRAYLELEDVLRAMRAAPHDRLAVLNSAPPEVQRRSMVASRQVAACVELAEWDRAITLLKTHSFHRWEMEFRMRGLYVDAYLGRGAERLDRGDLRGARQDFEAALEYPENLRIGKPAQTEDARPRWCAGLACEVLGDAAAAARHWEAAAAETYHRHSHTGARDLSIYRALCLRKLGRAEEADGALGQEIKAAREQAEALPEDAVAQMTLGLALRAAGRPDEAEPALCRALELYPWLPRAKRLLEKEIIL